jgi:hypothetical protein
MKNSQHSSALLALGLVLLQAGASQAQPAKDAFRSKVSLSPASPKVGQNVTFTVVTTQKGPLTGIVFVTVGDAKNKRVGAKDWQNQKLVKGKPGIYKWTWKPTAKGAYNVKSAIFGPKWKPTLFWDWRGTNFTVK